MLLARSLSTTYARNYFRSGWAFLIPYLAVYLLYAWLKWPVNPVDGGRWTVIPCLLHVYWAFHAIHVVLVAIALRAWWRNSGATVTEATDDGNTTTDCAAPPQPATGHRLPSTVLRPLDTVYRLLPWVFLALLFYIPGVYLEWPADPWEHLRRINEWHVHDLVMQHSSWMKSSYFIPYSLLSWATGLRQIFWLDFYYTGICLLLCWQYYRLARACNLGERASMVFVILQALLFGNNIFSFYRYYGISSSIYAQLGAVALTRIAIEALRPREGQGARSKEQGADHVATPAVGSLPAIGSATAGSLLSVLWRPLGAMLLLVAFTAFNHVQGLGIAGLGIAAVIVWRLVEWRRSMIWWLPMIGVLTACAACAWLPRHPLLDKVYQPAGWLNYWYGFNLLWPLSPAFERAYMILGWAGLFNLTLAVVLAARGQVAGWLAIVPILALLHPAVAIPLCNFLAVDGPDNIIIFHRLLFSIPTTLPVIAFIAKYAERTSAPHVKASNIKSSLSFPYFRTTGFSGRLIWVIAAICLLSLVVPSRSRLWHSLYQVPDDLAMRRDLEDTHQFVSAKIRSQQYLLLGSTCLSFIYGTQDSQLSPYSPYEPPRLYRHPVARAPTDDLWVIERYIVTHSKQRPLLILVPNPTVLSSTNSIAATLSNQWLPQETALAFAGTAQLRSVAEHHGLSITARNPAILFLTNGFLVPQASEVR